MRKLFFLFLVIIMVLLLPLTAFASETYETIVEAVEESIAAAMGAMSENVAAETVLGNSNTMIAKKVSSSAFVTTGTMMVNNVAATGIMWESITADRGTVSGNNTDSSPEAEAAVIIDPLRIDGTTLYPEMDNTYEQGYTPRIESGKAYIILPLIGQTYDQKVTVTLDLGFTSGSPFLFGNYSQTAGVWDGAYVFRFEVPLAADRINGTYPVTLTASYLNVAGNQVQQIFTIYVTISDGSDPSAQSTGSPGTESGREAVEKPKLFISACEISPGTVGGEEEFTVTVTIENIGSIRARSVLLSYGSDIVGIIPKETNNLIHLENISSGYSETASFELQTTKEVLAGTQPFFVKLDYEDLFGGTYTETRTFLVNVIQPAEMEYDPIRIPQQVTSGENISVPVNVFNIGKSTLRNVSVTISGPGLFPISSAFLGNILPGQPGNGVIEIYVGTLSLTEGAGRDYGKIKGICRITYFDDSGEEHKEEVDFSTEIVQPAVEDAENQEEERTVGQWWISVLVAFAIIAVMVAAIVVTKFTRVMRMK